MNSDGLFWEQTMGTSQKVAEISGQYSLSYQRICSVKDMYRTSVIVNKLHHKKVVGRWSVGGRPPTDHLQTIYRPPTNHQRSFRAMVDFM